MNKKLLWELSKLGLSSKKKVTWADRKDLKSDALPDDVFYEKIFMEYYRIEEPELTPEELELYLRVKNARNVNAMRRCAVVGAVCLCVLAVAVCLTLYLWWKWKR